MRVLAKDHTVLDLSKLDALLRKTHGQNLVVLRHPSLACADP